jgi:peptidyl-prolyl cis-trans isomerase D
MLRIMRKGQRWVMWLVIVGVGAVFVLYLGIGGGFAPSVGTETVVGVGERRFDVRDVQRVRLQQEQEYRRVLGDDFDPTAASDLLDQTAAGALLRGALLAYEAERLGLRATDEEVRRYLRRLAGAEGGGRIDEQAVTNFAEREYGSLKRFEQALRDDLLARKASRLITESVTVSDGEARDALKHRRSEVSLAVVHLEGAGMAEGLEVDPSEADRILQEEPERVRQAYEERKTEFDRPEEVRARHILVRVDPGAEPEEEQQARERAEAILERIREGADFADVALEESEDPGSQSEGGDLGFFPRGRMVQPFEDVAFALQPGETSDVVKSVHGFHVIRVEEKRAAQVVPFEEARRQIALDLARSDAGRRAARAQADALSAAVRGGQSLVDAAREQEIAIDRPEPIRRRPDGYVPGVGAAPEVVTAAFALSEESPSDPRVYEVGDGFVLVELLSREEPDEEEIQALLPEERERLQRERRGTIETAWLEGLREDLSASGALMYDLNPLRSN